MVHSLPRSRAQAWRTPMSGLPSASSQAFAGSSASTQVMDRLIVPCVGMGSIGFVAEQPAAATQVVATTIKLRKRGRCTGTNVARAGYAPIARPMRRPD